MPLVRRESLQVQMLLPQVVNEEVALVTQQMEGWQKSWNKDFPEIENKSLGQLTVILVARSHVVEKDSLVCGETLDHGCERGTLKTHGSQV